jgi:hypothetical protein
VLFELNPDYKNNYTIQANIGIQREIAKNLSIEVAYQMYHGLHIQQPVGLNYCEAGTPGCPATAANITAMSQRDPRLGPLYRVCGADTQCFRVNDAGITQFTDYESRGSSLYHGLTASLMKRFSNHFSFQANYTWSKAIDDNTDFNSAFAHLSRHGSSPNDQFRLSISVTTLYSAVCLRVHLRVDQTQPRLTSICGYHDQSERLHTEWHSVHSAHRCRHHW